MRPVDSSAFQHISSPHRPPARSRRWMRRCTACMRTCRPCSTHANGSIDAHYRHALCGALTRRKASRHLHVHLPASASASAWSVRRAWPTTRKRVGPHRSEAFEKASTERKAPHIAARRWPRACGWRLRHGALTLMLHPAAAATCTPTYLGTGLSSGSPSSCWQAYAQLLMSKSEWCSVTRAQRGPSVKSCLRGHMRMAAGGLAPRSHCIRLQHARTLSE